MALLTVGRTTACDTSCSGGVGRLFAANKDDVLSITEDSTGVTAITMDTGKVFYEFETRQENMQFLENVTVENCSTLVEQSIEAVWYCRNQTDRNLITDLAENCCGMIIIHVEETGTAWIWGFDTNKYAYLATANGDSGRAFNDSNVETVTISCRTNRKAVEFVPGAAGVPLT